MKNTLSMANKARQLKNQAKSTKVRGISDDESVVIVLNGLTEVEEVEIADEAISLDNKKQLVRSIKQALKDASNKLQKEMQQNINMDELRGMLGV